MYSYSFYIYSQLLHRMGGTPFQAGLNSANVNDIEVYYVARVTEGPSNPRGTAFASEFYRNMATADLNSSFVLPNKGDYYTAGHEAYHIFSQTGVHAFDLKNLFHGTTGILVGSEATITDTKRLNSSQQTTIHNTKYAH